MIRTLAAAMLLVLAHGCGDRGASPGVTVFVAASTLDAVEQIARDFESETGIVVRVNAAATSMLTTQIIEGAESDLFLAASPEWADRVIEQRSVIARVDLLSNQLVVIVPADTHLRISSPSDVAQASVKRLALADTEAVPVGIYGRRALESWGIWPRVRERLIIAQDARHALWLVESGGADAGIVYSTDAAASDRVRVALRIDAADSGPVTYPLLLLHESPAARAFHQHLQSPRAAETFRGKGYGLAVPGAGG